MRKFLLILELVAVGFAGVFGFLWLRDPNGPYEPLTFLLLLIGSTLVEIIRRQLPEPKAKDENLAHLETKVSELLECFRERQSQESTTRLTPETAPQVTDGEPVANRDELANRILRLIETRQALLGKLRTLAQLRNVQIDESEPTAACENLSISSPFDDAIIQVLDFTKNLATKHEIDVRLSEWVDGMANAAMGYLDHVLGNLQPAASASHATPPDGTAPRAPLRVRFRDGVVCDVQLSASIQVRPEKAPAVVALFGTPAEGQAHAANTIEACALSVLEGYSAKDARQARAEIAEAIVSAARPKLTEVGFTLHSVELRTMTECV